MQTQVGQTPGINLPWQAAAAFARYAPQAGITDYEWRCGSGMKWAHVCCCQQAGTSLPLAEGFASYMGTSWLQQCVSENRYLLLELSWRCIYMSGWDYSVSVKAPPRTDSKVALNKKMYLCIIHLCIISRSKVKVMLFIDTWYEKMNNSHGHKRLLQL